MSDFEQWFRTRCAEMNEALTVRYAADTEVELRRLLEEYTLRRALDELPEIDIDWPIGERWLG